MPRDAVLVTLLCALLIGAAPGGARAAPPPNDSPAGAVAAPALPAILPGRTTDATMDIDEPAPLTTGENSGLDRSVWFSYLPDSARNVLADTCDANFDNHLDVYTGPVGALVAVPTRSDDYSGCLGERRTFAVTAGIGVLIRVTTLRSPTRVSDGGTFHLSLIAQEPAVNDAFARASVLAGTGSYTASLAFSTIEFGEPSGGADTGSVWYRLSPPRSEPYTVQLAPNPFGAGVTVFEARSGSINGLRPLTAAQSYAQDPGTLSFNALAGHHYYVRVSTSAVVAGDVALQLTTNSARGIGLLVTLGRNTLASVRRSGFRAVLSCARTCTLGADLSLSAREARRLKLLPKDSKQRRAVRIGHVGGALQSGRATTVAIPIASRRVRSALAHARSVRLTLTVSVHGTHSAVSRTVTLRRSAAAGNYGGARRRGADEAPRRSS